MPSKFNELLGFAAGFTTTAPTGTNLSFLSSVAPNIHGTDRYLAIKKLKLYKSPKKRVDYIFVENLRKSKSISQRNFTHMAPASPKMYSPVRA